MRRWGSVLLRQFQLSNYLRQFDPSMRIDCTYPHENIGVSDVAVVSKTVASIPDSTAVFEKIRSHSRTLVTDLVDGNPGLVEPWSHLIDGYLCASLSEYDYWQKRSKESFLVPHQVDATLDPHSNTHSEFNLGYVGRPENAAHLKKLKISTYNTNFSWSRWGSRQLRKFLPRLSHHYLVRKYRPDDGFKPGLKAFNAAHFGAAVIGSRSDSETMLLLGADYPYLAQDSTYDSVVDVVREAEQSFGSELHQKALRQTAVLKNLSCPARVVGELHQSIRRSLKA